MIIVLGNILIKEGSIKEALEVSQRHVEHSRKEPGCIEHGVHIDSENCQRLVFVEKWSDQNSLQQHFKAPTSIQFVKELEGLAASKPEMAIYDAAQLN